MGLLMHPVVPLDNRTREAFGVVLAALPVGRANAALRISRPGASVQQLERRFAVLRPRPVCLHLTGAGDHFPARCNVPEHPCERVPRQKIADATYASVGNPRNVSCARLISPTQ